MADPQIPATPQQFSFGGRLLYGRVTGFNGAIEWRSASHKYWKRDGAREEDLGREQFRLEVMLVFIGATCARDYDQTVAFLDTNRTALLVHPIAGRWIAFCKTASHRVQYSEATNRIEAPIVFVESELDSTIPTDVPDIATSLQNASGQQSQFQQSVAAFLGALGKAQSASGAVINQINSALNTASTLTVGVVDYMAGQVNQALGVSSNIVGLIAAIQSANDALVADVSSFITAASDLFNGTSDTPPPGAPGSIANLLATVQTDVATLENALFAATPTPAGCTDAVADSEIMVDMCLTVSDAITAAQPPTATVIVASTQNLLVFSQKCIVDFGLSYDALTYASKVMSLNRIANPAAIPSGTRLIVPTA